MAVKRKPTKVEQFIQDGGSDSQAMTAQAVPDVSMVKGLKLRLPLDLLIQVDAVVARRRPSPSRHQWILEAIYEKLDREGDG